MNYYAVQVGEYWAQESYGSYNVNKTPSVFDSFKDAYTASKKLNGKVVEVDCKEIIATEMARLVEEAATNE